MKTMTEAHLEKKIARHPSGLNGLVLIGKRDVPLVIKDSVTPKQVPLKQAS